VGSAVCAGGPRRVRGGLGLYSTPRVRLPPRHHRRRARLRVADAAPALEPPTIPSPCCPPALAVLSLGSPIAWWTLAVGLLAVVLATVETGWTRLSRARLAERDGSPGDESLLQKLLDQGDRVEDALIVLRVASQVTLVSLSVVLFRELLGGDEPLPAGGLRPVVLGGVFAFLWITLLCRLLPGEMSVGRLERAVRMTRPVLVVLAAVLGPPIELVRRIIRRATGHTADREAELYQDEILSQVEEGEREGHLGGEQREMIEAILELRHVEVHELMTPRTEIDVVEASASVDEAREATQDSGRSRYPLIDGTVDRVVGVLHVKDLLKQAGDRPVRELAREPWFVPEGKHCTDLLREFRVRHQHLAVVLDEYGGTAGIITIEDVLEEIVGDIDDEFDEHERVPELQRLGEHTVVADGAMHVDELNQALGTALPESDDWSTLGGFVFHALGRLPTEGEELRHGNVLLRVVKVVDRRVDRVQIETLSTVA